MSACVRAFEKRTLVGSFWIVAAVMAAGCAPHVLDVVDPPNPLLRDLVGWWSLDDGPGSTVARDSSGNGNDGTLVRADPAKAWIPGVSGTCLELLGAGHVQVPRSRTIDAITDEVTVSAWIYFEGSVSDYGTALSREIGTTVNQHYHVSLDSREQPNLFIGTYPMGPSGQLTVAQLTSATTAPRFTWKHLAGVYDGATARLYVDGVQVGSQTFSGPFAPDSTPLILGGNGNGVALGVTEEFPGRIDELMLYKRALSADEIGSLFALRALDSRP
jgi:hypothetical protein